MKTIFKILFLSLLLFSTTGCSSTDSRTTRTVSTVDSNGTEVRETSVTEEEHDENDSCGGVLSCTVDFLGDVIAFPFRLVGGLVTAIF